MYQSYLFDSGLRVRSDQLRSEHLAPLDLPVVGFRGVLAPEALGVDVAGEAQVGVHQVLAAVPLAAALDEIVVARAADLAGRDAEDAGLRQGLGLRAARSPAAGAPARTCTLLRWTMLSGSSSAATSRTALSSRRIRVGSMSR